MFAWFPFPIRSETIGKTVGNEKLVGLNKMEINNENETFSAAENLCLPSQSQLKLDGKKEKHMTQVGRKEFWQKQN